MKFNLGDTIKNRNSKSLCKGTDQFGASIINDYLSISGSSR
jgi:hypothetical protein